MKTYLLDILNRYSRFSENLDVKTVLCNRPWLVFNDTGHKELYIFQENGSLIASVNGNVTNATWQYIPANKSIIISFKEKSYMLHPAFLDNKIFALQQDGTSEYAFMIDETQSTSFQPKSLTELRTYFENVERKRIEDEEQQKRKVLYEQKRREEEQKRQREFQLEKERQQKEEEKINNILKHSVSYKVEKVFVFILMLLTSFGFTSLLIEATDYVWVWILSPVIGCGLSYLLCRELLIWIKSKYLFRAKMKAREENDYKKSV